MRRSLVSSLVVLLLFLFAENARAQSSFVLMTGPVFPTGDFADDNPWNDRSGLAGVGIGAGVQYGYQLKGSNLGFFVGANAMYNRTSEDAMNQWAEAYPDVVTDFSEAINIPVSAGVHYILKDDKKFPLYGKAGFAVSFFKMTSFNVRQSGYFKYTEEYDMSDALGYVIGGGVSGNTINIEVNYMALGEHRITGTWTEGSSSGPLEEARRRVGMLTVTLGLRLK
ncbi:MAG: hypothetical protein R6V49_09405 [Bacteroidales bacterium]